MANKIITSEQLSAALSKIKSFVDGAITASSKTTTEAIKTVENKINKIQDTSTGTTYTLSMENGLVYLDDGKE